MSNATPDLPPPHSRHHLPRTETLLLLLHDALKGREKFSCTERENLRPTAKENVKRSRTTGDIKKIYCFMISSSSGRQQQQQQKKVAATATVFYLRSQVAPSTKHFDPNSNRIRFCAFPVSHAVIKVQLSQDSVNYSTKHSKHFISDHCDLRSPRDRLHHLHTKRFELSFSCIYLSTTLFRLRLRRMHASENLF